MEKEKSPGGLRYNNEEEYRNLLKQVADTPPGKKSRELHRKLKAFGTGLDFWRRYPYFGIWVSSAALLLNIILLIFKIING